MKNINQFKSSFNFLITVAYFALIFQLCQGIRFNLNPNSKKCIKHEMYANQLAVGEYEISSLPETIVDVAITDSKGHIAFKRDNIDGKGKFAVTSDQEDIYNLCFTYTAGPSAAQLGPREVSVDFRVGSEAKEYNSGDKDKLTTLEQDLNRIEDLTNSIIADFAYLKQRESEMRDTNESTNTRLFYQTLTSVIILIFLTTWQVLYLRTFFKSRKLID